MSRARLIVVRASLVRVGDVVALPHASFKVRHIYSGGGRLTFITDRGFPVDIDPYGVLSVMRRVS